MSRAPASAGDRSRFEDGRFLCSPLKPAPKSELGSMETRGGRLARPSRRGRARGSPGSRRGDAEAQVPARVVP